MVSAWERALVTPSGMEEYWKGAGVFIVVGSGVELEDHVLDNSEYLLKALSAEVWGRITEEIFKKRDHDHGLGASGETIKTGPKLLGVFLGFLDSFPGRREYSNGAT